MSIALTLAALLLAHDPVAAQDPKDCPRRADDPTPQAQHEAFCFVGWLYGPGTLETIVPLGADAPRVFTSGTQALMTQARRRAGQGAHPAFDADPICDCQDPTGLRLLSVTVPEFSESRATAVVFFDFGQGVEVTPEAERRTHTLHLRREGGAWRIEDVSNAEGWSFRASLRQD